MSLRKRAESKAQETTKAIMKIGFIGQIKLETGIVPRLYKDWTHTDECFVPNGDESEAKVRAKVIEITKRLTGEDKPDMYPCVAIRVIPDTSLTPTSRYDGGYISTEPKGRHPRTHKRESDFLFDHMSPEFDDLEGKKVWAHISWNRMTSDYGGDLSLLDKDDTRGEWGLIITHLPNKRAAADLAKALRENATGMDDLAIARGYDPVGVREAIRDAALKAKGESGSDSNANVALTAIGEKTQKFHMTLNGFLEAKTLDFLQKGYDNTGGDIEATAEKCGAEPGDVAIILGKPDYFKDLMAQTGLGEQEAVVKVAADTGLVHAADLARLLDIDEAPF